MFICKSVNLNVQSLKGNFVEKKNLHIHKKVCCKCYCHEQFSSLSELLNHVCPEENITKPAAKQFKPDKPAIQTPLVPFPSNQVQIPEQPILESIVEVSTVILPYSRSRKSLKIKRRNKKSAEQNNKLIKNPESAQPTTCQGSLILIEANPAALKCFLENSKTSQKRNQINANTSNSSRNILSFTIYLHIYTNTLYSNVFEFTQNSSSGSGIELRQ